MNRTALIGLLALSASCGMPLVMVEVDAPSVCITRQVNVDGTGSYSVSGTDQTPSQMGVAIGTALGTTIDLKDNLIELPSQAKDLLDLDVQIKSISLTALAPNESALDGVNAILIRIVPPATSGLAPKEIISYDRAAAGTPPGGTIVATGQELNLADYLYSGQLHFDYTLDVSAGVVGPWSAEMTACVATRGKISVSVNDAKKL